MPDSKPHSRELIADIERGIRSTGDTNIGSAARYQARAALRSLEEQYEDVRDKWVTLDAEYDHLKEQLEASQAALQRAQEEVLFLCSDEDDIRKGLREQLEAAQEALREIADAPGLEFFNAPEVARRALECVCAEINTRHCPVHGQDSNPAKKPDPQFEYDKRMAGVPDE